MEKFLDPGYYGIKYYGSTTLIKIPVPVTRLLEFSYSELIPIEFDVYWYTGINNFGGGNSNVFG
jgi:hypothetical protein